MKKISCVLVIVGSVLGLLHCSAAPDGEPDGKGETSSEMRKAPRATGDDCSYDMDNGLKEPGKINKDGKCCGIWSGKCN